MERGYGLMSDTNNEFYIDFNTTQQPGKLQAVKVTIELVTITDMNKSLAIGLCYHPLYPELKRYVKANP